MTIKLPLKFDFDLEEYLESLPKKERDDLVDRISCIPDVAYNIAHPIMYGFTPLVSNVESISVIDEWASEAPNAIAEARRALISYASTMATEELKRMADEARYERARHAREEAALRIDWQKHNELQRSYAVLLENLYARSPDKGTEQ